MYETFESILARMLSGVREADPEVDTREGSLIHAALAPAAVEFQLMQIELKTMLDETFADTQSLPYLIRRAAERGVMAKEGTKALCLGSFDAEIPIGSRFMLGELIFCAVERRAGGDYVLECETAGARGNAAPGGLIPLGYIPGLTSARLTAILSHGTDAETAEQLRARYRQSLSALAFGGNKADYIQKAGAIPGVGGVKVSPAWQGGGTVLLVITDTGCNPPIPGLVAEVQEKVNAFAPVGHTVTVRGAETAEVNIAASFAFQAGYDFQALLPQLRDAAEGYFAGLRTAWASDERPVIRISGLEQRFLAVPGVIDVTETALNGLKKNLTAGIYDLPVLGGLSHAG